MFCLFNYSLKNNIFPPVEAASQVKEDKTHDGEVHVSDDDEDGSKKKKRVKEKVGFRDRKVSFKLNYLEF